MTDLAAPKSVNLEARQMPGLARGLTISCKAPRWGGPDSKEVAREDYRSDSSTPP
jgi:hypothetical protein